VRFEVVVKPKHPEHAAVFTADARLTAALQAAGLAFSYLQDRIHDIAKAASAADCALSLLPTTPGMDLLLAGKPSAYFNRLTWGDPRFDDHPLLVRNADEIVAFLRGVRAVRPSFIDTLDPWRDGASRERIAQAIVAAVADRELRAGHGAAKISA